MKNNAKNLLLVWLLAVPAVIQCQPYQAGGNRARQSHISAEQYQSSDGVKYRLERLTNQLSRPWGMAFVDTQRLLITQKSGTVVLFDLRSSRLQQLPGVPQKQIDSRGQGGLLDVLNGQDGWWYFSYSRRSPEGSRTALARAALEPNQLVNWQELLITNAFSQTSLHYGSRLAIGPDGMLYLTVGDRGLRQAAQRLDRHHGSVLRVDRLGRAPQNNPRQGLAEIWSYGHRNPQGIAFDNQRNLWVIEHGPRGGDEVNQIFPGGNYGWPLVSAGREYFSGAKIGVAALPGMRAAAKIFIPSIAPSSLLVYSGKAFPTWRGQLFAGALVLRHLNRMEVLASGKVVERERLLAALGERIRHIIEGPQGYLYLLTDSGRLLRIRPAS